MTFEIEGADELLAVLKVADKRAVNQLSQALMLEGEFIMTKAKKRTPVDMGTLRSSGHVKPPNVSGTQIEIELGFGGAASAYALAVHEHPSQFSPPSWSGGVTFNVGGPKFLESAVRESERGLGKRLASNIKLI